MVAPLKKKKMSDHDKLKYLQNELTQLQIKAKRYQLDTARPKDDLAFYIKCNEYFIQRVQQEIKAVLD